MNITYGGELSVEEYCMLRKSVGWNDIPEETVRQALDKSDFIVSAAADSVKVGMARLISDGTQALIMDVVVHPDFQGNGIGKEMMNKVMKYLNDNLQEEQRILVNLNATKGRESFYLQFGFEIRPTEKFGKGMAQYLSLPEK